MLLLKGSELQLYCVMCDEATKFAVGDKIRVKKEFKAGSIDVHVKKEYMFKVGSIEFPNSQTEDYNSLFRLAVGMTGVIAPSLICTMM